MTTIMIMISTGSSEGVACNGDMQTSLCDVDADGQDVLAVLPVILEVGAVAGLFAVVDQVEAPARSGQDRQRGDAHIVGYYVLVYADTTDRRGEGLGHRGGSERVVPNWYRSPSVS
jgi:hypothetical protein